MNVVPRVEQQWEALYPDLNVDAPLIIENQVRELPAIRVPSRNRPQRFADIVELPQGRPPRFTDSLKRIGYSSEMLSPSETHRDVSNDCDDVFPANIFASDVQVGADSLELCEYDMDEQDAAFLGFLITEYQAPLNAELFEYAMSALELEMYKLEMLLPMQPLDVPDEIRACTVCGDTEGQNLNAILFCDGCDIAIHQDCYGVPFIPDGQWLCRQCQAHRGESLSCKFCPHTSGAFKQLSPETTWGHVVCALWIPELHLGNPVLMEPINGYSHIPRDRWRLRCMICREKTGACIQCTHGDCSQAFHATCAQAAGLFMKMKQGIYGAINIPSSMEVYCPQHTPDEHASKVNLSACTQRLESERQARIKTQSTRNQYPYWRTSQGTMVVPSLVSTALPKYLKQRFEVEVDNLVIERICRYWLLKREKTCSPFSRRLRTITDRARHDQLTVTEQLPANKYKKKQLEEILAIIGGMESLGDTTEDEALGSGGDITRMETSVALTPPLSPPFEKKDVLIETLDVELSQESSVEPGVTQVTESEASSDPTNKQSNEPIERSGEQELGVADARAGSDRDTINDNDAEFSGLRVPETDEPELEPPRQVMASISETNIAYEATSKELKPHVGNSVVQPEVSVQGVKCQAKKGSQENSRAATVGSKDDFPALMAAVPTMMNSEHQGHGALAPQTRQPHMHPMHLPQGSIPSPHGNHMGLDQAVIYPQQPHFVSATYPQVFQAQYGQTQEQLQGSHFPRTFTSGLYQQQPQYHYQLQSQWGNNRFPNGIQYGLPAYSNHQASSPTFAGSAGSSAVIDETPQKSEHLSAQPTNDSPHTPPSATQSRPEKSPKPSVSKNPKRTRTQSQAKTPKAAPKDSPATASKRRGSRKRQSIRYNYGEE